MKRAVILLGSIAGMSLLAGTALLRDNGGPVTRTYYIAADEVEWDYAPGGSNPITGMPFTDVEHLFIKPGDYVIGRRVKKAQYREYTGSTFTTLRVRLKEWEHLGLMGPLVRAVVGDTIRIVFRNNTKFPASVHHHGVFYDKSSEGAPYDDKTTGAAERTLREGDAIGVADVQLRLELAGFRKRAYTAFPQNQLGPNR